MTPVMSQSTGSPSYAALLNLPVEIFNEIMTLCSLSDVLRVRQCCRSLYSRTLSRSFWYHWCGSFCAAMGIPSQALCLKSLTGQELEICAARHLRFRQKLLQETSPAMHYSTSRIVASNIQGLTCLALAPGGRHLLVVVAGHLQLWDLGIQASFQPALMLTLELPHPLDASADWGRIHSFQYEAGRCRFILSLKNHTHRAPCQRCYIYALGFDPVLGLLLVGSKELTCDGEIALGHIGTKLILGRRVPDLSNWTLLVHDFLSQITLAIPEMDGEYGSATCTPMFDGAKETLFVKVFSLSWSVLLHFSLPDFSTFENPSSKISSEIICKLQPTPIFTRSAEIRDWGGDFRDIVQDMAPITLTVGEPAGQLSVETVISDEDNDLITFSKTLLSLNSKTGQWEAQQVHNFSCDNNDFPLFEGELPSSLALPDGSQFIWFFGLEDCHFGYLDLSKGGQEDAGSISRLLLDQPLQDPGEPMKYNKSAFTPFMGRLVSYLTSDKELMVWDYVNDRE